MFVVFEASQESSVANLIIIATLSPFRHLFCQLDTHHQNIHFQVSQSHMIQFHDDIHSSFEPGLNLAHLHFFVRICMKQAVKIDCEFDCRAAGIGIRVKVLLGLQQVGRRGEKQEECQGHHIFFSIQITLLLYI